MPGGCTGWSRIGETWHAEYVYAIVPDIVTRAPTRIDFGGGWTDVPPYSVEVGGFVCNLAITRYATVTVRRGASPHPEKDQYFGDRSIATAALRRFHLSDTSVRVESDFPLGAGLGGSSAVGVATVAALTQARGETMSPTAMAELSRDIEISDLGVPGGRQDHYAAAYGGALGLRFSAAGVDVKSIPLSVRTRSELERRCLVIYTGQSRISGETITAVMTDYRRHDPRVVEALKGMRETAEQMPDTLVTGDIDGLAALVSEQWTHQRSLHPAIPTPAIDEIIERAQKTGAVGCKALGASGGGCVLVIAGADRVDQVREAVAPLGELLSFAIDLTGVKRCT
jgi:D-glycero-alpha-D-manno-heptose-7-phosphate kinase